ncbi:MAG: hypothetical protein WA162_09580 [Thermodesulfobacteriota bacterium]
MSIGSFVSASLDLYRADKHDVALSIACSAVDATAAKGSNEKSNKKKYRNFIRQSMHIITTFGFPGIEADGIRIKCTNVKDDYGRDLADDKDEQDYKDGLVGMESIIYHTLRCGLIHQCESDRRIEFTKDTYIGDFVDRFKIPSKIVVGLIMAVVLSPHNKDEKINNESNVVLWGKEYEVDSLWGKGINFIEKERL